MVCGEITECYSVLSFQYTDNFSLFFCLFPPTYYVYSCFIMALAGVRVIELAGLAPAPFCGMILADFGAKVIRVDRTKVAMPLDTQGRGKKSVAINLKTAEGVTLLRKLCVQSDVVLEPFRKGQVRSATLICSSE